jgi:hypothetical protein
VPRGRFYLRCESDEWDFIRALNAPRPFDAAVISDRYLADYPEGHARHGQPRDRLIAALTAQGSHWSVDPDTARLEQASSSARQRPRAGNRPLARALSLPLSAERLGTQEAVDSLVEAGSVHQHGSRAFVAPYLEVAGPADPRFAVNLRLLERASQLAGDRTLVAYLQVLRGDLMGGGATAVAAALARAGAEVIFIRARRFEAEQASTDELLAYATVIDAATRAGARVVADCVGRLGPALIATGADGFTSNARSFRKVSDDLHPAGGGGAGELLWELPGATTGMALAGGSSPVRCDLGGCPAPTGPSENHAAVRVHDLHEFQRLARLAAAEGLGYAAHLAQSPSPVARGWAQALAELARRAA